MPEERIPIRGEEAPRPAGIREILGDRAVRVVIGVTFVIMLGFGLVAPILPLYALSFGVDYAQAGLLVSSFAIARLVVDLIAGPIVDRVGERRSATGGLLIVAVSSLLTGLAPNFTMAVLFRGFGGAGSSVLFAAMYSYLLKVVPNERMARTSGLFYGSFNLGIIAGGPVGGVIAHAAGLNAPLFAYAGVLVVAAGLYLKFVRDPATERVAEPALTAGRAVRRALAETGALLRQRVLLATMFVNFAYLWMVAAVYDTLVPLFGDQRLGMTPAAIGGAFAVALATELIALYPAGHAADRLGRKPVLSWSLLALVAAIAVVGHAPTPLVYAALLGILGFASGAAGVVPTAMLSDVAPKERSGTAVGIFRFAGDLGFVFGPLVAGWSAESVGLTPAFAIVASPLVLALAIVLATPETLRRRP